MNQCIYFGQVQSDNSVVITLCNNIILQSDNRILFQGMVFYINIVGMFFVKICSIAIITALLKMCIL